ncbi:hypothetical protein VSDKYIMU_CDS0135 [Enterococcus phage VRE9_4]
MVEELRKDLDSLIKDYEEEIGSSYFIEVKISIIDKDFYMKLIKEEK